jgi:hypothetical protein
MHRTIVTGLLIAAAATPAAAQDTAEKIGIAAALGLTAGTGKTTLGDNAGSIEAALLNTDAMDQAGRIIAGVVRGKTAGKVLVVGRTDSVDLITGPLLSRRMTSLTSALDHVKVCVKEKELPAPGSANYNLVDGGASKNVKVQLSDITAALATDVTVATIKLNVDDRMLIQSIALNRLAPSMLPPAPRWELFKLPTTTAEETTNSKMLATDHGSGINQPAEEKASDFVVPAEVTARAIGATLDGYQTLLNAADKRRYCSSDEAKAAVIAADAFVDSINTAPEGGGATPLGRAIQAEAFGDAPLILRVVAEEAGGTSIVSANIWYTLGFPDSATVSAGLIASFRLVDPTNGSTIVAGVVRCAARPINIKHARAIVASPVDTRTTCAYRTSG